MYFANDIELYQTIGKNIKYYRKRHHLTQADLAELSGISLSYLSKVEATGCNKSLSISVLNNIANALDIEITNFFEEECSNEIT